MLAVLSPAKKLHEGPRVDGFDWTPPHFTKDVGQLARKAKTLSSKRLMKLMKISQSLADLNRERFQELEWPLAEGSARQAIFSFAGDTYVGFDVDALDADDLDWAQDHVAILSGLYGVLRPLDGMAPYRLEMGTQLENRRGKNLYEFWGPRIRRRLDELTDGHADRTIVNCASNEYFRAAKAKELAGPVVTPVFKDVKDGQARTLMLFAKRARGAMASWMVRNRVERAEDLQGFDGLGYSFVPGESDEETLVFSRPQP